MSLIIFTGLDGMLLPTEDCNYEPVLEILRELESRDITLIPVTNNTRAEVEELLGKIHLNTPFVVEQGSGIFIPQGDQQNGMGESKELTRQPLRNFATPKTEPVENYHCYQLGCTYTEARAALKAIQEEISKILRGFGDMDEENIQSLMGLSLAAARRAKAREFSEYFIIPNRIPLESLQSVAREYGFKIVPEENLALVMGGEADKSKAVIWLKENYQNTSEEKITTVGIGSTKQDLSLLEAVDLPLVVPSPNGIASCFEEQNWQTASASGCLGWVESIKNIYQNYSN